MAIANLIPPGVSIPQVDSSWLSQLGGTLGGIAENVKADRAFTGLADRIAGGQAPQVQQPSFLSRLTGGGQQTQDAPMIAPVGAVSRGPSQGSTYAPFIDTIKQKVTNPYGLAAVAATGRAESGWSPQNANRAWSDPSQSGQAGTAGGILSWRAERLQNLRNYAASKGEQGNGSPQTQAEFFLAEDPNLVQALNNAKSPDEAANLMANAWKFAGYNQAGGEAARRRALTTNYYASEFRDGQPAPAAAPQAAAESAAVPRAASNLVASLDPSAGIPMPGWAGQMRANDPGRVIQPSQQEAASAQPQQAAVPQPAAQTAPTQVAQQGGSNILTQGSTPVTRGSVDPSLIQYMLRDRNLREVGLKLWAANAQGQNPSEPWQFTKLDDGTLVRWNQQTGESQRVGNFAKPQDPIKVGADDVLLDPVTHQPIYSGQKPKFVQLTPDEVKQSGLDPSKAYQRGPDNKIYTIGSDGVTINNVPGENATSKAAGEGLGKLFSGIFDEGLNAKTDKANVGLLRSSLANSPNGLLGGIASLASDYGVNVGPNADQVQVAKSIIAKMVPAQRVPGSGTTSDRDLAMFQSALPRLSGTTEGNGVILDTLDSLADYKSAQADIVTQFYAGEIKQEEAVKKLRALPDPFTAYKAFAQGAGGKTSIGIQSPKSKEEFDALPAGAEFIAPDGSRRRKL